MPTLTFSIPAFSIEHPFPETRIIPYSPRPRLSRPRPRRRPGDIPFSRHAPFFVNGVRPDPIDPDKRKQRPPVGGHDVQEYALVGGHKLYQNFLSNTFIDINKRPSIIHFQHTIQDSGERSLNMDTFCRRQKEQQFN